VGGQGKKKAGQAALADRRWKVEARQVAAAWPGMRPGWRGMSAGGSRLSSAGGSAAGVGVPGAAPCGGGLPEKGDAGQVVTGCRAGIAAAGRRSGRAGGRAGQEKGRPSCPGRADGIARRPGRARPALGGGRPSDDGGLAATSGAGSGGEGDTELGELLQVETGFVGDAELVLGDGTPVGFCGQAPNTIQEPASWHILLAELGGQVVGLAERAELRKDQVKVSVREVQMRFVLPEGFDVKGVAVRDGKALLLAGGPHPAPLAEVETIL
jgi:hypothetical protein